MSLGLVSGGMKLRLSSAARGRRSEAFAPDALGDLTLWLSAQQSPLTTGGGAVEQIDDLSGNGLHASQTTATDRPDQVSIDGRNWLDFDGLSQHLLVGDIGVAPRAFFIVFEPSAPVSSTSGGQCVCGITGSGFVGLSTITGALSDEVVMIQYPNGTKSGWLDGSAQITAAPHIVSFVWTGSRYDIWIDGAARSSGANGTPALGIFSQLIIGRRANPTFPLYYSGRIGEIVVYETFASADRTRVESYLSQQWGVSL